VIRVLQDLRITPRKLALEARAPEGRVREGQPIPLEGFDRAEDGFTKGRDRYKAKIVISGRQVVVRENQLVSI